MNKIEMVRRENIKAHIKKCKSLSELKKLAKMKNNNKVEYLQTMQELEYNEKKQNFSQSVSIETTDSSMSDYYQQRYELTSLN